MLEFVEKSLSTVTRNVEIPAFIFTRVAASKSLSIDAATGVTESGCVDEFATNKTLKSDNSGCVWVCDYYL